MRKIQIGIAAILFLSLGLNVPVWADVNEISQLKEMVDKLNNRIAQLEERVQRPTNIVPATGEAPTGNFIEAATSGIKMTGFVDTAYHWNFDNPPHVTPTGTAIDRNQSIGVFDYNANSFTLHAVELAFEKPAPAEGGVGFRTDIDYGEDAKVTTSGGSESDEFDIQQAYVEARLPIHALDGNEILGNSLYFRAGKFVTLSGAEVIEAKDNWNTTRSMLFGYAIPFTHTGVRAVYGLWNDKVTVSTGLNNGWDLLEDNNDYKTFEGQIAFKPNDSFLLSATTYIGPENLNQDGHKRQLYDFVALWNATDKLSLMANVDVGTEHKVLALSKPNQDADWWGFALYGRYQATEKAALATRMEYFVDDDTFRVGSGNLQNAADARERDYWEWTLTGEYKIYDNLISRLEYRYDWADTRIFDADSSQSTVSAQLIYSFA